jgi:hypothetical protein
LYTAVRLYRLAENNLSPYLPVRHRFDVEGFLHLLRQQMDMIIASDHRRNPWSPETAPRIELRETSLPPEGSASF